PRLMTGDLFGERVMNNFSLLGASVKICAAGLCLAVIAAMPIVVTPVEAQTSNMEVNGPRARITVEPRSFLDAGTEVLPGERKFTDYAFHRRCRGHSIFRAAIIRTVGNPGLYAHHGPRRWLARRRGLVFDAFERGAKHGRARGLAPVAAAGAIRSSEPL